MVVLAHVRYGHQSRHRCLTDGKHVIAGPDMLHEFNDVLHVFLKAELALG